MKAKREKNTEVVGAFLKIRREYRCNITEMYHIVARAMGPNAVHFRTFHRWINGDGGALKRIDEALRILEMHFQSAPESVKISDPITALRELQRNATDFRRIQVLSVELNKLIAEATARHLAITEYLMKSIGE